MLNATCKPLNSPLDALIAHADAAQLPVFLANALGSSEPSEASEASEAASAQCSVAARVALLEEHLSALVGSDLFVTGIINPLNEHPALPPSHLARLADAAKAQMEQAVSSSLAQRLQQLEAQAEQAAARSRGPSSPIRRDRPMR